MSQYETGLLLKLLSRRCLGGEVAERSKALYILSRPAVGNFRLRCMHGRHLGGGDRGTCPPHVLKGGGHNIKCPPHVFRTCMCVPPKELYPYKFRLERGLKLCIFSSPNAYLAHQMDLPLQSPKSCKHIICDRKG